MLARLSLLGVALALLAGGAAAAATWSAPATLRSCGAASDPQVVFPFSLPTKRSGHGAILWLDCGALESATLHSDDRPSTPRRVGAGGLDGPLAVAGTTAGQIVAAVGAAHGTQLGEAAAGWPLRLSAFGSGGGEVATAVGWIGDADVVSTSGGGGEEAILLRVQRHYAHSFAPPLRLAQAAAPISALTVAMDFRADTIILWVAGGELHAQWVSNDRRRVGRAQVLGPAGYDTQVAAVLSDDNHAFVMWTDQPPPGSSARTTIFLERSRNNVIFPPRPRALVSFEQPPAQRLGPGAVSLVRITPSEGVLAAWTLVAGGSYEVRAAGLTTRSVLPAATVSQSGADLRLAATATGPHDDVVLVLERAPRTSSGFDTSQQTILATRTLSGGHVAFGAPVALSAAGANGSPAVAVDPSNDQAVVVWQARSARSSQIAYAVRSAP